jgi:ketosteroid isomerase-like protein
MSREHVDLVVRGMQAFNRGDWDAALELVAEDVVWMAMLSSVDGEKLQFGREALRQTWEAQRDALGGEDYGADPREIRDLGAGTVLVQIQVRGRGTTSGVPIAMDYVQLWTIRRGLAVRIDNYATVQEALEDSGWSSRD